MTKSPLVLLALAVAFCQAASETVFKANVVENLNQSSELLSAAVNVEPSIGISVSGGGSRSMICAIGGFRALQNSSIVDEVDFLSSVSGGSWFSSIYMFATKYDADTLLGDEIYPEELTLSFLSSQEPGKIGDTLETKSNEVALKLIAEGTPLNKLWQYSIAEIFLSPFDLNDKDQKYMAANENQVSAITSLNPSLDSNDFLVQNPERPAYFTMGGTLEAPLLYQSDESNIAYFKMSPSYVGNPYGNTNSTATSTAGQVSYAPAWSACDLYEVIQNWINSWSLKQKIKFKAAKEMLKAILSDKEKELFGDLIDSIENETSACSNSSLVLPVLTTTIGGGLLEAFALGGQKVSVDTYGINNVTTPDSPFTLGEAVGISSAAFVSQFNPYTPLQVLNPRENYFGIVEGEQEGLQHQLGDGGNLENTGLVTLIRDGVRKAISFVNTREAIVNVSTVDLCDESVYEKASDEEIYEWGIDQIANLFGYSKELSSGWYMYNQIFRKEQYHDFLCKAQTLVSEGKPVVIADSYEIIDNSFWGTTSSVIKADIVWIVNQKCTDFESLLPSETQQALNTSDFPDYPYYPTMLTNDNQVTTMTKSQINLLAAQTQYAVSQNIEYITNFLGL